MGLCKSFAHLMCSMCELDYLRSISESKSRLPISEFNESHCMDSSYLRPVGKQLTPQQRLVWGSHFPIKTIKSNKKVDKKMKNDNKKCIAKKVDSKKGWEEKV